MSQAQQQQQQQMKPFVRIVEQPAKCAIRFRYECEGRSAGSIPGVNSTAESKSYPTIQVCNYRGKAVVVVSCVTKDLPYRPHPHNLVGKEGCKKGVCTLVIDNSADMTCSFTSLGIQCVKRKDIEESLKLREMIKVDPFRTGFNHRSQASSIDLNVVRLCFQVFIEGPEKGKFTVQLPPIVSEPIYDKKAMAELIIIKLSHYAAPCTGGKEIILLCDRVAKDDIQVRFSHEATGQGVLWEAYGEFLPNDVHKQVAISLRTPKYYDESITQPVTVQIQLRRPSDGCLSLPRSFQLTPKELDPDGLVRKRHKRIKEENYDLLQEYIQLASRSPATGQIPMAPGSSGIKNEMSALLGSTSTPPAPSSTGSPNRTFQPTNPQFHLVGNDSPSGMSPQSPMQFTATPTTGLFYSPNHQSEMMSTDQFAPSTSSHFQPVSNFDPAAMQQFLGNSPNYQVTACGSPSPSLASYSSVPSPAGAVFAATSAQPTGNHHQELPNEVMERFDSLDIDSSELIHDLDLNSNTIISLMLENNSGLSLNLNDSFSDITNNNNNNNNNNLTNNQQQQSNNVHSNQEMIQNRNQTLNSLNRSKMKLNLQQQLNNNLNNGTLDTPTIEMVDRPFDANHNNAQQPIIYTGLDIDNNNL